MADEHASLTLTLTDEMSDKLSDITDRVERLRQKFSDLQKPDQQPGH